MHIRKKRRKRNLLENQSKKQWKGLNCVRTYVDFDPPDPCSSDAENKKEVESGEEDEDGSASLNNYLYDGKRENERKDEEEKEGEKLETEEEVHVVEQEAGGGVYEDEIREPEEGGKSKDFMAAVQRVGKFAESKEQDKIGEIHWIATYKD